VVGIRPAAVMQSVAVRWSALAAMASTVVTTRLEIVPQLACTRMGDPFDRELSRLPIGEAFATTLPDTAIGKTDTERPGTGMTMAYDKDDHHHHRHDRFFFGFFPIWYPSGGYYGYGYPGHSYDNYDGYYQDNGYYSGQSDSASIQVLVQEPVARRGYYTGQVDGVIGPQTRSAIREFQRDNGLAVTGRITPELLQAQGMGTIRINRKSLSIGVEARDIRVAP
jgi:Putative peptidoglycan binding domain